MHKLIQRETAHYSEGQLKTRRYNRTGATTVIGGVGFVDTPQADADSTTLDKGLDNVVAVTTARMQGRLRLVVAAEAAADNERMEFIEGEGIRCRILVDSTTDIAKNDKLVPVNAGDHMVKATGVTNLINEGGAVAAHNVWYAEALEARTADTEGTIECMLYSKGSF